MPELRLVVLALQDKLAYGTTFEAALRSLFGGEISTLTASSSPAPAETQAPSATNAVQPTTDINTLIAEAGQDFDDYQRLTAAGKLAEAGQKLEALKAVLNRLNAHPN
jgi:hypothetical protein